MPVFGIDTGQILGLALVAPLIVAAQLGLLRVRNRVRSHLHASTSGTPELESVVREALDAVFAEAAAQFDESVDGASFRAYLVGRANEVADRTEARVELTRAEREVLRTALVDAVLEAFHLDSAHLDPAHLDPAHLDPAHLDAANG